MATTVQSILQEYFEQFAQNHPLSFEQRLAAERMRDCRTLALGEHVVGCPEVRDLAEQRPRLFKRPGMAPEA